MIMKIIPLLSAFILAVSVLSLQASAAEINYYGISADIDNSLFVRATVMIVTDKPINHLEYNLDFGIYNLSVETGAGTRNCGLEKVGKTSVITCDFYGMEEGENSIKISFYTRDVIKRSEDAYEFKTGFPATMPIKRMFATVKLPTKGVLSEDVVNQSFFPPDGNVITDGRRMILTWEMLEIEEGDKMTFSVLFEVFGQGGIMWDLSVIALTSIVVIIMVGVAVYMRRGTPPAEREVKVLPLLNKDEKRVVDIIARHDGEARQRDLVNESDFSKAKVSRMVKNLKERGVVDTVAISGRENKVILKIKGVGTD
jgi:uncharacterized membrane protein